MAESGEETRGLEMVTGCTVEEYLPSSRTVWIVKVWFEYSQVLFEVGTSTGQGIVLLTQ